MAWIVDRQSSQEELANEFKKLMLSDRILQIPGAHDAMAALVAKKAGFSVLSFWCCLYSQSGIARSWG